jgi:hypothetical protein
MADDIEMVIVNGVRYRPEHAPKESEAEAAEKPAEADHKMRTPRKRASKSEK